VIAAAVLALALLVPRPITFAPATITARVRVPAADVGVALVVVLASPEYFQSSSYPFVGNGRQQTVTLPDWRRIPTGEYVLTVALIDQQGHVVSSSQQSVRVLPGLGG
jgi:hypothetical protein